MSSKQDRARLVEVAGEEETMRPEAAPRAPVASGYQDEEPSLADYVWTIVEHRGLIAAMTTTAILLAAVYVVVNLLADVATILVTPRLRTRL